MDRQRMLIIFLVLLLIGGAYYYYQIYQPAPELGGINPAIIDIDARISELRPLAEVQFNAAVLNNTFFRSLRLITATTTPSGVAGRINPFIPF